MATDAEVIGVGLAGEVVARGVARDVARERSAPHMAATELMFLDGVTKDPGRGDENWAQGPRSDNERSKRAQHKYVRATNSIHTKDLSA